MIDTDKITRWIERIHANLFRDSMYMPFGKALLGFDFEVGEFQNIPAPACIIIEKQKIMINTSLIDENLTFEHLCFIILHEICHAMFNIDKRRGSRDPQLYNIAEDYVINLLLEEMAEICKDKSTCNVVTDIDGAKQKYLFDDDFVNMTSEEVYDILIKEGNYKKETKEMSISDFMKQFNMDKDVDGNGNVESYDEDSNEESKPQDEDGDKDSEKDDSNSKCEEEDSKDNKNKNEDNPSEPMVKVTKTSFERNNVKINHTSVEFPQSTSEPSDNESGDDDQRRSKAEKQMDKALASARHTMKDIGHESARLKKLIDYLLAVEIPWDKILEQCLEEYICDQNEVTWSKQRLTSCLMDYILPGYEDDRVYNTVIFVNDESGSISEDDSARFHDVIFQSKQWFKELIVIKHDDKLVWEHEYQSDEIGKDEENEIMTRRAFGGTSHKEVFTRISELSEDKEVISCVILCTDLYSDIEKYQHLIPMDIPIIYIGGPDMMKDIDKIKGMIIRTS